MENFTPVSGLIGGMLIGLSAVMLMLFNGRIAGISGIASGLLARPSSDTAWRAAFVIGVLAAPALYGIATGPVDIALAGGPALLAVAGFIVGLGSSLGSGCTSGHGVCGLARLSPRSLVATAVFMTTAFATVFIARHLLGA
ncbi:YeeE/YedE family protein [Fodinicurvata sp. EGI_FJ10296]|uniref:YeeE/YedE family protein n=1 Tax=Fodinicurvata sp. EGI_FJ10296 TaxID=3231908 RepID=UPI0034571AAE